MRISNAQFDRIVADYWLRRLHAMNAWVRATIAAPGDPAGADDALRKAFDMTRAWGRGAAGRAAAGDDYSTYLHGMDEVIGSMEKEKSADEATLKACAAGNAP